MICALLLGAALPAAASVDTLPLLPASTAPVTVEMAVGRLEAFDRAMTTLSADFRQSVRWEESDTAQVVEGHVDYRKPQLLRIEQRVPEPQTIVGDGTWLWVYRPSTEQVIQTRMEQWKKSQPLAEGLLDFGAYASMLKAYRVSLSGVTPLQDGHKRFTLILRPKSGSADMSLRLVMTTRHFFPTETVLRAGSVTVHSFFSNIRYNPVIPAARFQFQPPPGAEVFRNFKPPQPK